MKVVLFTSEGAIFEALREAVKQVFPDVGLLSGDMVSFAAIADCDLALIEVTAGNPLGLYFAGAADALGRKSALLAAIREDLPARLLERAILIHGWNLEFLKGELRKLGGRDVAARTENPQNETASEKFQRLFGDLLAQHGYHHRGVVEFEGNVFTLREQEMDLPLVQALAKRSKALNLRVRLL